VAKDYKRQAMCSHVARRLCEERERQKLSRNRLSEMAGLSRQMITFVEREERNPSLETLFRITVALGLPLSRIIKEAEEAADKKK
jgi:transcriptional regulator with XRE-family HTH domain